MTDLEKLTVLAWAVRRAYDRYSSTIHKIDNPDLAGYCYEASARLYRLAKTHGLDVKLCQGVGHWFVEFGGKVVDVTSTQFQQPEKVAVLDKNEAEKRGDWWKLKSVYKTLPFDLYHHGEDDEIEKEMLSIKF